MTPRPKSTAAEAAPIPSLESPAEARTEALTGALIAAPNVAGPTTLATIIKSLEDIVVQAKTTQGAAGLQAARAAIMDIAKLNGLMGERHAPAAPSLEELLAAIPDDDG